MKIIGANLLVETVSRLINGDLKETSQSEITNPQSEIHHAPKIFTETCKIDWNKTVDDVHNIIRGLSPFPGAFTHLDNKILKIYRSQKEELQTILQPGNYETDHKTYLRFACTNGYIYLKEIQLEGKKKMMIEDFLRGYKMGKS